MGDTCRDTVAISLLSEEAREGCEATDSWWLSLTIDVPVWNMAWQVGPGALRQYLRLGFSLCFGDFSKPRMSRGTQPPHKAPTLPVLLPGTGFGGLRLWGASGLSLFGALGSYHVTWAMSVVLTRWGVELSASGFFTVTVSAFGAEGCRRNSRESAEPGPRAQCQQP